MLFCFPYFDHYAFMYRTGRLWSPKLALMQLRVLNCILYCIFAYSETWLDRMHLLINKLCNKNEQDSSLPSWLGRQVEEKSS